jgi:hypothetical protein
VTTAFAVLAEARFAGRDGQPGDGRALAPYLAWAPLPYDIPVTVAPPVSG